MTKSVKLFTGLLGLGSFLLAGCVKTSPSASASSASTGAAKVQVKRAELLTDKPWPLAIMEIKVGRNIRVVRFQLHPESAPRTVENFVQKANSGFYKDLAFHRTIRNYLVQTGDPLSRDNDKRDEWGTGGKPNAIRAETSRKNVRGAVVMARLDDKVNPGKLSHESQFFICLRDLPSLDGKYSPFGTVLSGMDALDLIGDSIVDTNDTPLERIEIKSLRILTTRRPPEVVASLGVDELSSDELAVRTEERPVDDESKPDNAVTKFFKRLW